jgi:hypothetical protein
MAKAPQKVTRTAPVTIGAPPAQAANEPSSARKTSEPPDTAHIIIDLGTVTTIRRGRRAPTENVPADASTA